MFAIILFAVFESLLFPRNIFFEDQLNPALLYSEKFELSIGTGTNFGLSELRVYTIYARTKSYGINAVSLGGDIYRENIVHADFGFPVTENLAAGCGIAMLNYWIKDNCNRFTYSLKTGGAYVNNSLELGGWIDNINIPRFSNVDYLPFIYSLKLGYLIKHNLSFAFAVRGIETDLPFFNFGWQYSPYQVITFGVGLNTDPIYLEYILKLTLGGLILNYTGSNHQYLGLSHFFTVNINP